MKTLAIVSGGMDSVTLAYFLKSQGDELTIMSFDYGQRHKKELKFAKQCAVDLSAEHILVDCSGIGRLIKNSSLTDDVPVPHGHYADSSMKATVVPNRNAIMLAIAFGVASSRGIERVAIAVHAGDHPIYPDCRPEFLSAFADMERIALDYCPELYAPFQHITKAEIVSIGAGVKVPFERTWSCYEGKELHCGQCGTCVERQLSFKESGIADPVEYIK